MVDSKIINMLYKLSKKAYKNNEVPVSCIITRNGKIVSKAYNMREKYNNPLYHAEVIAIQKLCKKIKNWRLEDYEMYVTLKPCNMCVEIIKASRISKVYYLLESPINNFKTNNLLLHKINFEEEKFKKILTSFFKEKR